MKHSFIDRYSEQGQSLTDQDAQSIWDMGYKANAYYFQEYPYRKIVVNERVQTKAALIRRADQSIIKRLLGKCPVQPLKADALAALLYGDEPDKDGYMTELIGEALTMM